MVGGPPVSRVDCATRAPWEEKTPILICVPPMSTPRQPLHFFLLRLFLDLSWMVHQISGANWSRVRPELKSQQQISSQEVGSCEEPARLLKINSVVYRSFG